MRLSGSAAFVSAASRSTAKARWLDEAIARNLAHLGFLQEEP